MKTNSKALLNDEEQRITYQKHGLICYGCGKALKPNETHTVENCFDIERWKLERQKIIV